MNGIAGYAGAVVNPALALAIESTRQHLHAKVPEGPGRIDPKVFRNWPAHLEPPIDEANLLHWQPDCRASVLAFEALSGLSFQPVQGTGAPAGGELLAWGTRDDGEAEPLKLITITRPSPEVLPGQARTVAGRMRERLMPKSDDLASRERLAEITAQVAPPLAFWCAALPMHPDRMPRTLELIDLTLLLSSFAVQRFKHALAVARPNQVDPRIFPAILTPAHASLPSGHATEAFAVAQMLTSLLDLSPADVLAHTLSLLAKRIADNREVAGLHYPIDTQSGRLLGTVLARYLVARCTGSTCLSAEFQGHAMKEGAAEAPETIVDGASIKSSALLLGGLWHRARVEWGAVDKRPA